MARAEESRKRALDRLSHPLADLDVARALNALKRAAAEARAWKKSKPQRTSAADAVNSKNRAVAQPG